MQTRNELKPLFEGEMGGAFDQVGGDLWPCFLIGQVLVNFLDDGFAVDCNGVMDVRNGSPAVIVGIPAYALNGS